jgi:hypothetical protein
MPSPTQLTTFFALNGKSFLACRNHLAFGKAIALRHLDVKKLIVNPGEIARTIWKIQAKPAPEAVALANLDCLKLSMPFKK